MATPAEIADFHHKIQPNTIWQKFSLVLLCGATMGPAMDLAGFGRVLPEWPLWVWIILSSMVGGFVGFTYYPLWRYCLVGLFPGIFAGPCVLLLAYFYTLPRETVYKAEMALVWAVGLAPAALVYYVAMRLIVLSSSRTTQPDRFAAVPQPLGGEANPFAQQQPISRTNFASRQEPPVIAQGVPAAAAAPSMAHPFGSQLEQPKNNLVLPMVLGGALIAILGIVVVVALFNRKPNPVPVAVPQPAQQPNVPVQPRPNAPQVQPPPNVPGQAQPANPPVQAQPAPNVPVQASRPGEPLGDAALAKTVDELLSPQSRVQRTALDRLAKAPATPEDRPAVAPLLTARLADGDVFVRRAAAQALGNWGTADSVPPLIAALGHDDFMLRRYSMEALGKLQDARAAAPIAARLAVGSDRVPAAAALRALGPAAEEGVIAALDLSDVFARAEACRILADIGTAASLPKLEAATSDKNGLVSAAAKAARDAIARRQ